MEISTTTLAILAIVSALGIMGVVAIEILSVPQDSEARGCSGFTPGFNASKGRCFHA